MVDMDTSFYEDDGKNLLSSSAPLNYMKHDEICDTGLVDIGTDYE